MKRYEVTKIPLLEPAHHTLLSTLKSLGVALNIELNDEEWFRIDMCARNKYKNYINCTLIVTAEKWREDNAGLFIEWYRKPNKWESEVYIQNLAEFDLVEVCELICKTLKYEIKKPINLVEEEFVISTKIREYKKKKSYKHDDTTVRKTAKHLPYGCVYKNGYAGMGDDLYIVNNKSKIRQHAKKEINNILKEI